MIFLCSTFDIESTDFLEKLNVPAYKIASHSLTDLPLIEHVSKKGKPMLVSTGMSTLEEIDQTVELIRDNNCPFMLFHCVSCYPQAPEESNLKLPLLFVNRGDFLIGRAQRRILAAGTELTFD